MKKLIFILIILAALVELKSYLHYHQDLERKPLLNREGQMWNGGKPGLPVQINMLEDQLKIATSVSCQSIRIQIRGTDGLQVRNETDQEYSCQQFTEQVYFVDFDREFAGNGYVVADVTVNYGDHAESTSKAFVFEGRLKMKFQQNLSRS